MNKRNKRNQKNTATKEFKQTERMIAMNELFEMEEIFEEDELLEMEKLLEEQETCQDEFLLMIGKIYEAEMAKRSNEDFVVNPPQMKKFIAVLGFFLDLADCENGRIEALDVEPKQENAGLTATFPLVDIYGNNKEHFFEIISYVSAITMEATDNGVCLSVAVPEVFVPKAEQEHYSDSTTDF